MGSVRNGLDAFRDGTIMKEAFVLLYAFVLIALVSQHFGLSPANAYMARSVLVNIGVTIRTALAYQPLHSTLGAGDYVHGDCTVPS